MKNYYGILGISALATEDQIDKALEISMANGQVTLNDIQEIKMYLKNPEARKVYDARLVDFLSNNPNQIHAIRLSTKYLQEEVDKTKKKSDPVQALVEEGKNIDFAQQIENELTKSKAELQRKKTMFFDGVVATIILIIGFLLLYILKLKLNSYL